MDLAETPLTKTNKGHSELQAKHDPGDLLRGIAEAVLQQIMEPDVEGVIGSRQGERSDERTPDRITAPAEVICALLTTLSGLFFAMYTRSIQPSSHEFSTSSTASPPPSWSDFHSEST